MTPRSPRSGSALALFLFLSCAQFICAQTTATPVGIFDAHNDVGTVLHAGSVDYDAEKKTYTISGSGENMWLAADAFQFVWKKVSGDVTFTADIGFPTKTGNEHKKAVLMLRQSLDADSVYADVALHASGLTSLQFRDEKGAVTREIQSNALGPEALAHRKARRLCLHVPGGGRRRAPARGRLAAHSAAGTVLRGARRVLPRQGRGGKGCVLEGRVNASHSRQRRQADSLQHARNHRHRFRRPPRCLSRARTLRGPELDARRQRVSLQPRRPHRAPCRWQRQARDHRHRLRKPLQQRSRHFARRHAARHQRQFAGRSRIARSTSSPLPAARRAASRRSLRRTGTAGRRMERRWRSSASATASSTSIRSRQQAAKRRRLTTAKGLDDGPEYSPDGKYIYFNSERTGHMQIWRMKPDGSEQEQVFSDDLNNWFPHISPDGQWMVFLTYGADVTGHPENKDVMLRLMSLDPKATTRRSQCWPSCSAGRERSTFRRGRPTASRWRSSATCWSRKSS